MVTAYQLISENKELGNFLVSLIEKDSSLIEKYAGELREKTEILMSEVLKKPVESIFSEQGLKDFESSLESYLPAYIRFIRAANYLPEDTDKKLLKIMEDLRMYTEPVYGKIDEYLKKILGKISEQTDFSLDELVFWTHYELRDYISEKKVPDLDQIKKRSKSCGMYMFEGQCDVMSIEDANKLKKLILDQNMKESDVLKGSSASPGTAIGVARIVLDPHNVKEFNDGDILVAEMTRPEYVPLMKKTGAVVTDAGGVLCHAAIVSRELGKPCVIGTQYATEILKDGEEIEIDATAGLIKRLN